jgi:hypothetical protein
MGCLKEQESNIRRQRMARANLTEFPDFVF